MYNIKFTGIFSIIKRGIIVNQSIEEIIWAIDSKNSECKHAKNKFGYEIYFVDVFAREAFKTKSMSTSILNAQVAMIITEWEIKWLIIMWLALNAQSIVNQKPGTMLYCVLTPNYLGKGS